MLCTFLTTLNLNSEPYLPCQVITRPALQHLLKEHNNNSCGRIYGYEIFMHLKERCQNKSLIKTDIQETSEGEKASVLSVRRESIRDYKAGFFKMEGTTVPS